jgi:predicted MPP superfamily phosphohydrolase
MPTSALSVLVTAAAMAGHLAITVWLFNRLHALAWPRKLIKTLEKALILGAAITGLLLLFFATTRAPSSAVEWLLLGYACGCWLALMAAVPYWLVPKILERTPSALHSNHTTLINVAEQLGRRPAHGIVTNIFARIPRNQIFSLAVQRKTLLLHRLPAEFDGLTIAHLSDLHMTGQLGREFYDVVVDQTNALEPDLVVITGDILEKSKCLPWISSTLGRLQARHGKYFILGNHEKRLADVPALRQALTAAGLTDLGGRCKVLSIRGAHFLLSGNEWPWFGTSPDVGSFVNSEFRILLSHTPDNLPWAKVNGFDLMLAGHNHGGQIRLPYIGAVIAPSHYGCRYAGGLFHEPPTLLHVTRGIAGIHPIRLNCPPEIALLVLKRSARA